MKWLRYGMLVLLIGVLVFGASCSTGTRVRIGWAGSEGSDYIRYRYETFTGTERNRVRLDEGETLDLSFDVTVEKGALEIAVLAPNGDTLWERGFSESDSDSVALVAEQSGRHTILVAGTATGGSFDVSWEVLPQD